ncbi:TPA: ParB N-terminal domain-containing protein [Clostridioides difficile]|uniref:ParB N-terminal domain-containing protein n=1 Tax=Clostridioides difficile TaxID=1496 RepID=UPI00107EBB96|nr:ParB N-terminal domain-containing protein [Clostridioides difficile]MBJ8650925.1 ParB N-terminal domain-containing protein [Clostridioides difficile]MBZ0839079.1 ParB N-terminal domain-containing protein [Clostridioides difficile]TGA41332.1 chromosome partitioning protein ParB [Clostridioides difficile]HBG1272719.1 ParB N-terminal domain-containing protein [Clostridioides difficile]
MNKREVIYLNLEDIKPYENNPRNNEQAIEKVVNSIKEFGFNNPITVDKDYVIVTGHTRYEASKILGLKQVPCIILSNLAEEQIKGYRLADNKIGEFSEWEFDKMTKELAEIENIDMSSLGFNIHMFEDLGIIDADFILEEELEEKEKKGKMVKCPHCNEEFEI